MTERRRVLLGVLGVLMILTVISGVLVSGALITDYDNLGTMARVVSLVRGEYLEKVKTSDMIDGAIKGIVESLNDPYSVYMPPTNYKELQEQVQGSFGGVGILVSAEKEHVKVIKPIKDTPAYKAGIKAGDIIFKVDGKDIKGKDIDAVVNMMRGKVGSEVLLTVFRNADNKLHDFKLTREVIKVPTVEGKILPNTKIAYISIVQFTVNTGDEFAKTIQELGITRNDPEKSKAKAVILDLRGNPGGELNAAVNVANLLVPKGPIVFIDYRSQKEEVYEADGNNINLPLVVLVDGNSASASEIVSGAIKDTKAGTLVGTKTFGKGVVQSLFELQNNAGLKLTTGRYLTPKRHNINKKGIEPDVKVEQPENATKDVQLEKAIQILKEKI